MWRTRARAASGGRRVNSAPEPDLIHAAWRKAGGFDPGTTLYTDRVILHNFFNRLKIDNPVKDVPKLPRLRKRPVAYADAELKRFFGVCDREFWKFWDRTLSSTLTNAHFEPSTYFYELI